MYCGPGTIGFAITEDDPTRGSPRFGSESETDKYLYLSDDNPVNGVTLDFPLKYFAILGCTIF